MNLSTRIWANLVVFVEFNGPSDTHFMKKFNFHHLKVS
jgi:hypothetical protein